MNKTDLLPRHGQLITLAREINEREKTITLLREKTVGNAGTWMCEVMLQGQALIHAKALVALGMWTDWLAINCSLISVRSVQRYMQLATRAANNPEIEQADTLRRAMALCIEDVDAKPDPKPDAAKCWPPYLEALGRVSKFVGYVERFPVGLWPDEGREKLRGDLLPIVTLLWPDKFAQAA